MANVKNGGKTKTQLIYESFIKNGHDQLIGQAELYLAVQGVKQWNKPTFYNVKRAIRFLHEAFDEFGPDVSREKAEKYVRDKGGDSFSAAYFEHVQSQLQRLEKASKDVAGKPKEPEARIEVGNGEKLVDVQARDVSKPESKDLLDVMMNNFQRIDALARQVGPEKVREVVSLAKEIGDENLTKMLQLWSQMKGKEVEEKSAV